MCISVEYDMNYVYTKREDSYITIYTQQTLKIRYFDLGFKIIQNDSHIRRKYDIITRYKKKKRKSRYCFKCVIRLKILAILKRLFRHVLRSRGKFCNRDHN